MAYGTLQTDVINSSTGLFSTNNAYSGIAKAWVLYNGTAQTISGSFNVSSVTYNSTGSYNINFTTAMPNANYSCVANSDYITTTNQTNTQTTTSVNISCFARSNPLTSANTAYASAVIFGA